MPKEAKLLSNKQDISHWSCWISSCVLRNGRKVTRVLSSQLETEGLSRGPSKRQLFKGIIRTFFFLTNEAEIICWGLFFLETHHLVPLKSNILAKSTETILDKILGESLKLFTSFILGYQIT